MVDNWLQTKWRDWRRGYTAADRVKAIEIIATIDPEPGAYRFVTLPQLKAMADMILPEGYRGAANAE
jgi:hypothetical protein